MKYADRQARVEVLEDALEGLAPWFPEIAELDTTPDGTREPVAAARRALHPGGTCVWAPAWQGHTNTSCGAVILPGDETSGDTCPACHRPIKNETKNATDGALVTNEAKS